MSSPIKHLPSHASLLEDLSATSMAVAGSALDAIVVPASRRRSLQRLISLSAQLSVPLVVLCSHQAQPHKIAERVAATFGARALIIDLPDDYQLLDHRHLTSADSFRAASAWRSSDLSTKRNLGLVLARLRNWNKILFIDDDIHIQPRQVSRLAGSLDHYPVASMASTEYPDNSVVCHARRLAGLRQDVFVSGSVLGVNTRHPTMSFFPDIYNEDWFFFAENAAARSLPKVGEVRQDDYQPYGDPERAAREELGDVLAEGLYALFGGTPGWNLADQLRAAVGERYWLLFLDDRKSMISETLDRLTSVQQRGGWRDTAVHDAQTALLRAADQLEKITASLCVDFIECWREDVDRWPRILPPAGTALGEREAMNALRLRTWISCGYGTDPQFSGVPAAALESSRSRSSMRFEPPGRD